VGWAGWNGVLGEADLRHLFNHFGSGDWFNFVSSLASRALSGILSSALLFFAVVALAIIIIVTAVLIALVLFFAVRVVLAVGIVAAFIVLVSSLFVVNILFTAAAAAIIVIQLHSAFLFLIFTLASLVVFRSAVFTSGGGADLIQVSWIFAAFFVNGVFLVERSDIRLKLEFGVSEFVGGLKIVVSAETALNVSEEWAHLDVDGVAIEVDTDVGFGEDDLNVLARFLNLGDLSVLAHDGLRVTDVLLNSVNPDLDGLIFHRFGGKLDLVASSKDLDLLLGRLRADFTDQNSEAWVGLRAAVLGQDGPASGEWDLVFNIVEGLDAAGLNLAFWVNLTRDSSVDIGPAADVLGSSNVERLEFHWEWNVLEGHILNWGLNSDIDVLLGSWVNEEIDLDLVLWVVDFNHGLLRVPIVVGLDSSEDLVGDVLEDGGNILVLNFNFVVHQFAGFEEWRVDSNRRAEVLVLASFFILIHGIFGVFLEHSSLFLRSVTLNLHGNVVAAGFSSSSPGDLQVANQFLSGEFTESVWGVRVEEFTLNAELEWLRVNFWDSRSLQDGLKFAISESFTALQLGFQVGFQFFVGSLGGNFSLDNRFPWPRGFVASPVALESFLIF